VQSWLIYNTYRAAFLQRVVAPDTRDRQTRDLYPARSPLGYEPWENVGPIEAGDPIFFLDSDSGRVEALGLAAGGPQRVPHPDAPEFEATLLWRVEGIGRFRNPMPKARLGRLFHSLKPHPPGVRDWIGRDGGFLPRSCCHPLPEGVATAMAGELRFAAGHGRGRAVADYLQGG
jgi:hypothetical protein